MEEDSEGSEFSSKKQPKENFLKKGIPIKNLKTPQVQEKKWKW